MLRGVRNIYQRRSYYKKDDAKKFMQGSKCTKTEMNNYFMYNVGNGGANLSKKE